MEPLLYAYVAATLKRELNEKHDSIDLDFCGQLVLSAHSPATSLLRVEEMQQPGRRKYVLFDALSLCLQGESADMIMFIRKLTSYSFDLCDSLFRLARSVRMRRHSNRAM